MFPWGPSEAEAADVESELLECNLELHFTETIADAEIAVRICKKKNPQTIPAPKPVFLFSPASYRCLPLMKLRKSGCKGVWEMELCRFSSPWGMIEGKEETRRHWETTCWPAHLPLSFLSLIIWFIFQTFLHHKWGSEGKEEDHNMVMVLGEGKENLVWELGSQSGCEWQAVRWVCPWIYVMEFKPFGLGWSEGWQKNLIKVVGFMDWGLG